MCSQPAPAFQSVQDQVVLAEESLSISCKSQRCKNWLQKEPVSCAAYPRAKQRHRLAYCLSRFDSKYQSMCRKKTSSLVDQACGHCYCQNFNQETRELRSHRLPVTSDLKQACFLTSTYNCVVLHSLLFNANRGFAAVENTFSHLQHHSLIQPKGQSFGLWRI